MSQYDTMGAFKPPSPSRWNQAWLWLVVALFGGAILTSVFWAAQVQRHGAHYDPQTLCDVKGASGVTVLLIDATDIITPIQRQAIANRLTQLLSQLRSNERLDVYEIRPDRDLLTPVFSKCRPISPDEVNEATGNKRLAQQRFDTEFNQRLTATLDSLLKGAPSDRSPIMEAVQSADVRSFQSPTLKTEAAGIHRRLIVVSDMLENGEAGSHYGGEPAFDAYKKTPAFVQFRSDLSGVDVVILYLRRATARQVQGTAHIDFWDRWFSAQGASLERAIPIEG